MGEKKRSKTSDVSAIAEERPSDLDSEKVTEDALKYAQVYKKIVITSMPPTLEESYILENRNNEIRPPSKSLLKWLLWLTVRGQICTV